MRFLNSVTRFKKTFQSQSGIGLVEGLVAVAILGVSAVSFISNLSAGAISVRNLDEQAIAQQLLTSQMETLKGVDYDPTGLSYPIISGTAGYSLTVTVDSHIYTNTDLQKITAAVWRNGAQVAKLENYKVNR
jgi:Tfp pilus assembly protein PilV